MYIVIIYTLFYVSYPLFSSTYKLYYNVIYYKETFAIDPVRYINIYVYPHEST